MYYDYHLRDQEVAVTQNKREISMGFSDEKFLEGQHLRSICLPKKKTKCVPT